MNPKETRIPEIDKTYDQIVKEFLETLSDPDIVAFLNSTFRLGMSLESVIERLRNELNRGKTLVSDYFFKIIEPNGNKHLFHIEAQSENHPEIALRMMQYGVGVALRESSHTAGSIVIELPRAVVIYLHSTKSTPREVTVTVKAPNGKTLEYTIPTELVSDYTPTELLEQRKLPLFPFYMMNFKKRECEKFVREWLAGCEKLSEMVKAGRIAKADSDKLMENSRIVIEKSEIPNKEEVLRQMTMFETIGRGTDWIELKRRQDEAVAQAKAEEKEKAKAEAKADKLATAKEALDMGLSPEKAAKLSKLPLAEVQTLAKK